MKNIKIYIAFAVLAVMMSLLYPREGKFRYEYQKGRPWIYETLIAPIDFPLLKTETEMLREREERSSQVIDYYNFDESVARHQLDQIVSIAGREGVDQDITKYIVTSLASSYEKGILAESGNENIFDKVISIKRDKRLTEIPVQELSDVNTVYNLLRADLMYEFPKSSIDSLVTILDIKNHIVPNLTYDEQFTQLAHREAVNYISPTKGMIYAGQLIVSKGEIVTSDICQMLDSYKAEYKISFGYSGSDASMWISHIILVLAMLTVLALVLYSFKKQYVSDFKSVLFFLSVLFGSFLMTAATFRFNTGVFHVIPYAILALYMLAFFKPSLVISVYAVALLPLLLIPENGLELYIINLTAGAVLIFSYRKFNKGWLQFLNIIFLFITMGVIYCAFHITSSGGAVFFSKREFMMLAFNSVLVLMLYPFVFLIERLYGFVSYARLWELSDTNNKLLQRLQYKAPGTFQHSLQVANLSEFAARKIDADSMLVRVGALYHDVGKSENPMCFIENQTKGVEYHKELTPEESAAEIIRHVDDGLKLAAKANLPQVVADFILSHHGTSVTTYFYNVYCNNGGDPSNVAPFTYKGRKPVSREEAILMLADSVEAASRTMSDYSEENVSKLVDSIVRDKFQELSESDLSLREVKIVGDAFKTYIRQIYHERIAYPKRKK